MREEARMKAVVTKRRRKVMTVRTRGDMRARMTRRGEWVSCASLTPVRMTDLCGGEPELRRGDGEVLVVSPEGWWMARNNGAQLRLKCARGTKWRVE